MRRFSASYRTGSRPRRRHTKAACVLGFGVLRFLPSGPEEHISLRHRQVLCCGNTPVKYARKTLNGLAATSIKRRCEDDDSGAVIKEFNWLLAFRNHLLAGYVESAGGGDRGRGRAA